MNRIIEVEDILNSAAKFGKNEVLHFDPAKFRDNKTKNKASKYDCTWIPIHFKLASGENVPLNVKFNKVITASAAKLSEAVEESSVKNLLIAFREFTKEEISVGDYAPKEKSTEEEQSEENEKCKKNIEIYHKSTKEFIEALEIIDLSYAKICEELKSAASLGFKIKKASTIKSNEDIPVFSIRQVIRKDKESDTDVKLEHPITRLKLMVNRDSGKVGIDIYNKDTKSYVFAPNVYDSRKMVESNKYRPVLAKVREGDVMKDLDIRNAGSFITYKSLIGGIVSFPEIIVSKFGLSLSSKFKELYVRKYKKGESESVFSTEDFKELNDGCSQDSDSDFEYKKSQPEEKSDKKLKVQAKNNDKSEDEKNSNDEKDDLSNLEDKVIDISLGNNDQESDIE